MKQVGSNRQVVVTVGGPHPSWPCHDGANAVTAHQSFDPAAAGAAALGLQFAMDTRAAIASVIVAMGLLDVIQQGTVGN
jgi:hypothetical protein